MFNKIKNDHVSKIQSGVAALKETISKAKSATESEMDALESQIQHLLSKRVELKERMDYIESQQKLFEDKEA
ncbi:hypothetical protein FDI99_gp073 [Shigella phage Sf14]|uniref:Uncharacterized protein n=2 Tax=Mooglevirus TaxID=1985303 RepID=A0A291AY80_9CAUD|nr:hypothetical protein FDI99_gp073 [Shigella phage Sf14]ATE85976.1 hypothetical protein Sf15_gp43 [Shigella phage Sf15]AUV62825.1 hypothetical protein Sf14_gp84 [Shigella phage Sf14]